MNSATTPTDEEWERNDRARREGARNLVAVAEAAGVDRFGQAGVVRVARRPDGSAFDGESPPNPDRETQSALDCIGVPGTRGGDKRTG